MEGHAVLDASGEVPLLAFGVEDAVLTAETEVNGQQVGIADEARQVGQLGLNASQPLFVWRGAIHGF